MTNHDQWSPAEPPASDPGYLTRPVTVMLESVMRVNATIDRLTDEENRDDSLLLEMSQAMLGDLIGTGELKPLADYIAHYTYLTRDESVRLAAEIEYVLTESA